jgi:hypothetical protein
MVPCTNHSKMGGRVGRARDSRTKENRYVLHFLLDNELRVDPKLKVPEENKQENFDPVKPQLRQGALLN